MAINNRHDFHAFSAFRCPNLCPATLGHHERRVDEAFFFIQRTSVAKLVSNIRQQPPQNLIAAPSLKAPMYRFVVEIALRQHMPLRTCVEKPQDCFKNATCRDRLASGTTAGNVFLPLSINVSISSSDPRRCSNLRSAVSIILNALLWK